MLLLRSRRPQAWAEQPTDAQEYQHQQAPRRRVGPGGIHQRPKERGQDGAVLYLYPAANSCYLKTRYNALISPLM